MRNTLIKTKTIINKYQIRANKRYGQNFLINDDILNEITESAGIEENDLVIEIGPGLGNLTEYILEKAKYALLVEIDPKMVEIVEDRFKNVSNFKLLSNDVLKLNIDEEIEKIEKEQNTKFNNIKVVANLPYYITTPIIFQLLESANRITDITVMIQKEVAERMVAKTRTKDFGILTLMVEYFSNAEIKLIVPNSSFIPEPGVTSAVIKLEKTRKYKVSNEKLLFSLIHKAFAQRRKKMINSLDASNFNNMTKQEIEEIIKKCDINTNARAEELPLEKYIEIIEAIEGKK